MRRRSRLFRSIVVFGSSLGAATIAGTVGSAMTSGCGMDDGSNHDPGPWGFIDASPPDTVCAGADGGCIDGNWGTIADAPNPDAPPDAKPGMDAK
jgi:hypothetical protein